MPSRLMASVRGMGVAVSVSTSISARRFFSASFWRTPKRCSSSMITRPRSRNFTSLDSSLWVPMTMSILPLSMPSRVLRVDLAVPKRDSSATFSGKLEKRSLKVWKCCSASSVVGVSTATWRPVLAAT